MSLGFITIPFPFLIFLAIIIFNIISAMSKRTQADDQPAATSERKRKIGEPIAYDLLLKQRREAHHKPENLVVDEPIVDIEPVSVPPVVETVVKAQPPVKNKSRFNFNLSQMQQAVVMKEILDKPKSLQ